MLPFRLGAFRAAVEAEDLLARRRRESEAARRRVDQAAGPRIVAGDFNLVETSAIYRTYWGDLSDAFAAAGLGFGNTKSTRLWGVRIDHILTDGSLRATACRVGQDLGSDHAPVIAEFEWRLAK